jgi:hypothetical protein
VLEVMAEHHLVDEIVEQLKDTPFDDEHWGAKFTIARQVFSSEELDALGSRLEATKPEQMQDPLPERDQIEL